MLKTYFAEEEEKKEDERDRNTTVIKKSVHFADDVSNPLRHSSIYDCFSESGVFTRILISKEPSLIIYSPDVLTVFAELRREIADEYKPIISSLRIMPFFYDGSKIDY